MRRAVLWCGAVLALVLGGCGQAGAPARWVDAAAGPAPSAASPLPSAVPSSVAPSRSTPPPVYPFYVDPASPAARQVATWQAQGRADDARQLTKISTRPVAHWLTAPSARTTTDVDTLVRKAFAARQMPVLVAYAIPHRDCGSYSAGGAASPDEYRSWMRAIAAGIGDRPAIVILEPDGIAQSLTTCRQVAAERYPLLADAVSVLKARPQVRVYLDAGCPGWVTDLGALAGALRQSGIGKADGFALNVSNFVTTPENVSYGQRLSAQLGGAHFVIDTGRNGNGPAGGGQVNGGPAWCNPPGRMLGKAPTNQTGYPRVDALLWVKQPGLSDGPCRPGEPGAGQWWPEYALDMAKRSP
jgi:endoglucanase